jgi:hypothetical protein
MQMPPDTYAWVLWLLFEEGLWLAWVLSPLWWPALKVWLQRERLPYRAAFVVVSAAFSFGLMAAATILAIFPIKVANLYLGQQFVEAGIAWGQLLTRADTTVTGMLVPLLISLPVTAWWGSRTLAKHWPRLCGAWHAHR